MPWTDQQLRTDRLLLRPFIDNDTATVTTLRTDADVRKYLGGPSPLPEAFTASMISDQDDAWCIATADTDISIGLLTFKRDRGTLELSCSRLGLGDKGR